MSQRCHNDVGEHKAHGARTIDGSPTMKLHRSAAMRDGRGERTEGCRVGKKRCSKTMPEKNPQQEKNFAKEERC